jgi:hypothetical protein
MQEHEHRSLRASKIACFNGAFVKTFFRVGHCASVREFNLMIIYQ